MSIIFFKKFRAIAFKTLYLRDILRKKSLKIWVVLLMKKINFKITTSRKKVMFF
jgi:hypothetical protein